MSSFIASPGEPNPFDAAAIERFLKWSREVLELLHDTDVARAWQALAAQLLLLSQQSTRLNSPVALHQAERALREKLTQLCLSHADAGDAAPQPLRERAATFPADTDSTLLFVYGTLKRGHLRAAVLANQKFLGPAVTVPAYRLFDCGRYPALVRAETTTSIGLPILGELYAVDDTCLQQLDEIEGVAEGLYSRGPLRLQVPQQTPEVESYFYEHATTNLRDIGHSWPAG